MKKILIIIRGAPASGKSTLARSLVEIFKKQGRTSLLIPDEFKWVMTAHDNRDDKDFVLSFSNYEYTLENYLAAGYVIITEDTWNRAPFDVNAVVKIGGEYGYTSYRFLLTVSLEQIKHQNILRPMVVPLQQLEVQYKAIYDTRVDGEIIVDTTNKKPEQITEEVSRYILG